MRIKTKEPDFERDVYSGALLNKNSASKVEYLSRRRHIARIEKLESSVENVSQDIKEIRALLQNLVGKNNE